MTSNKILNENCNDKPLCIISFLSDILDTQASGRNADLDMLKSLGDKYKAKLWGWLWTSPVNHPNLEKALGIGGFGYPALAVVNVRKKVCAICSCMLLCVVRLCCVVCGLFIGVPCFCSVHVVCVCVWGGGGGGGMHVVCTWYAYVLM